ncbi:hypothetical protein F5X96DRAFT_647803 [Biscogniauxia mediterranea]|nr:hypothetical protein F5X96DRAFT_647803 [Biscogniauxia mediterranea]
MAPELRARKTKEATISAPKSSFKSKAATPASKRKAAEDASPVASKKTKSTKEEGRSKNPKSSRLATTEKKAQRDTNDEDEFGGVSDDEKDEALALAKVIDSDNEDTAENSTETFQEGQDVGKAPDVSNELSKASKSKDGKGGVVYVGRIPHGFYEHEMKSYFSQFGTITRLRMSRNKQGASKHFAFIEFAEAAVAEIVVKTMDNYLLFGHILKVKLVPESGVHENLWKGANKRFKKIPWNKMVGSQLKKPRTESAWTEKISKEERRRSERAKRLQDIGYDFDGPKLKAVGDATQEPATLEGGDEDAPKAIEEAAATPVEAQAIEAEVGKETELVEEAAAAKKQSKTKKAKKAKTKKA